MSSKGGGVRDLITANALVIFLALFGVVFVGMLVLVAMMLALHFGFTLMTFENLQIPFFFGVFVFGFFILTPIYAKIFYKMRERKTKVW